MLVGQLCRARGKPNAGVVERSDSLPATSYAAWASGLDALRATDFVSSECSGACQVDEAMVRLVTRVLPRRLPPVWVLAVALVLSGCGTGSGGASAPTGGPTNPGTGTTSQATTTGSTQAGGGGPLVAEAQAAASGDIPDNQVFLTYHNATAGYSMKYPEGWALSGSGGVETIRDKNNLIKISVGHGTAPSTSQVTAQLTALHATTPSLKAGAPQTHPTCTFQASTRAVPAAAVRVDYATQSAPNAVTGKRVKLLVNRYYLAHGGKLAVVDLGTPQGVDNVDAYCLMITSFRWR